LGIKAKKEKTPRGGPGQIYSCSILPCNICDQKGEEEGKVKVGSVLAYAESRRCAGGGSKKSKKGGGGGGKVKKKGLPSKKEEKSMPGTRQKLGRGTK